MTTLKLLLKQNVYQKVISNNIFWFFSTPDSRLPCFSFLEIETSCIIAFYY